MLAPDLGMTWMVGRRELCLGAGAATLLAGCGKAEGSVLPDVELPALPGLIASDGRPVPGITKGLLRGRAVVLNVWASWCPYCQAEHDHLLRLSQDKRFTLVGLVFRDKPAAALAHLKRAGNPYAAVSADPDGLLTGPLHQRGVPSTYVVDRSGRVTFHLSGGVDPDLIRLRLLPAIEAALASTPPAS